MKNKKRRKRIFAAATRITSETIGVSKHVIMGVVGDATLQQQRCLHEHFRRSQVKRDEMDEKIKGMQNRETAFKTEMKTG